MERWEYKVVGIDHGTCPSTWIEAANNHIVRINMQTSGLESELNRLGNQGWKLVSRTRVGHNMENLTFRRKKA
jgi:hypothetical protein